MTNNLTKSFMRMMKPVLLSALWLMGNAASAQTDVTGKYIENPDFGARFAAWSNPGKFTYNIANNFSKKNGELYMEKWVDKSKTLGSNAGMWQTLRDLQTGTYTLVVSAQNISQASTSKTCTGAVLYAGAEQVEINECRDYSVVFTVVNGKADIGVKLTNCNGNWVCVDNFRLYYNGENADSIAAEQARLDKELADLKEHLANPTGTMPKVTTGTFVPTGTTIALGRSTISGTCKEKGFCWSTNPNPTILDEKTTETFDNNGSIYVMRGLKPSTVYYVRAYAMTSGYQVAYGDVVKIATLRKGVMRYGYDFAGDDNQNARINTACAECIWMYNALSYIPGFYLNVHYVYGAGAGDGTADCSYGGWMRVSQKEAYQQTGTILHETNHGVGVGTTNEWYNNANLRGSVTRGLWLGPRATQMVRFFDNNTTSTMTGDGTHMWPYGINGAQEDSYQPSNHALYFANILITHAMHQDGLICSGEAGFAMPAYVFQQDDEAKYYIKSESVSGGALTSYLTMTSTGVLRNVDVSAEEALKDDNYAWNITYNPATSNYIFRNVGTGKYLSYTSSTIKGAAATTPGTIQNFHLMPSREDVTVGKYKGTSYWLIKDRSKTLAVGSYNKAGYYGTSTADYNASNSAEAQRWLFLTADEISSFESEATKSKIAELEDLIGNAKSLLATPHHASEDVTVLDSVKAVLESTIQSAEANKDSFQTPAEANTAISDIETAVVGLLAAATPDDAAHPFDLTFMLVNPDFKDGTNGWSISGSVNYSCVEFFQANFDMNQTTRLKLPVGTYEVRANAFQRPGTKDGTYGQSGTDNVNTTLYVKTASQKVKNIWEDAQAKSLGGSTYSQNKLYIPDNMEAASKWFAAGWYDNSVMVKSGTSSSVKVGIKSSGNTASSYWSIFSNFRLYYYGTLTKEIITAVDEVAEGFDASPAVYFDLSGRAVKTPSRGIYIRNGKKLLVK